MHLVRFPPPPTSLVLALVLAICLVCGVLRGQEETIAHPAAANSVKASPITVESVRLEPSRPGRDTLCQLYVTLENHGEHTASLFAFEVVVGDESLEVYERELYVFSLAAGAREELRLFNFWTTESGRPAPKNEQLKVEVRLEAARWVEIERREDGEEIWTPADEVEGLPSAAGLVVKLTAKLGAGG